MDVAKRFGENLRQVRRQAGISQEELGMRSSLHRTEIGLLERGARVPRIDTLIKIASALAIPPGGLLEGIDWTPSDTTTISGRFAIAPQGDPQSN
jgi:transcriptional regulator with XRE-family HTH domain